MNTSSPKSTTSANELTSAPATLARLDRLRRTVRDVVQRTAESERDFATRANRLRAQFDQAMGTERERWAGGNQEAEDTAAAQRAHAQAHFGSRKARITRAVNVARQSKLQKIDTEESKRTVEVQHGLLEADQTRDADNAKNRTEQEPFLVQLANERAALDQLAVRARATFGGYRSLVRLLEHPAAAFPLEPKTNHYQLIEQLRAQRDRAAGAVGRARALVLPLVFRFLPAWFWMLALLLAACGFVPALRSFDFQAVLPHTWGMLGGSLAGIFALWFVGRSLAMPHATAAAHALNAAAKLHDACAQQADASFKAEAARIAAAHATTTQTLNAIWKRVQTDARKLRNDWTERLGERARKLHLVNDERQRMALDATDEALTGHQQSLQQQVSAATRQLETGYAENLAKLTAARDGSRRATETDWQHVVLPLLAEFQAAGASAETVFPPWRAELWKNFRLPDTFTQAAKFASLEIDLDKLIGVEWPATAGQAVGQTSGLPVAKPPASSPSDGQPEAAQTGRPEVRPARFSVPLLLVLPEHASVLFETRNSGHGQVIGALNNLALRLLTSAPPGRLTFTIFDPVGLGQNFAGIMHLADYEERVINSRIWTQPAQFEQRLADLSEHIEKVTQMYLRNEYASLAEYNAQAGRLAEKYHFLVMADFPVNFSDLAVKRLQSIAASGPRCGVHLLIHWDQRKPAPVEFVPDELRKNSICIVPKGDGFSIASCAAVESERLSPTRRVSNDESQRAGSEIGAPFSWDGLRLTLDAPPDAELATQLLQQIGKDSTDSYRVEMPFEEVVPEEKEMWSLDTTSELRVPVGRTGATKLQYLALGQGTRQHGLIAGKTGSGKSTLFHVIITNLALWCSPDQVEFYLVDFKKGVEFKCYATHKLPHARVIAIESDREFGLSVLQRVDDELKRRGDLFRKLGAQDIAGYKRTGGKAPMPRVLLLIDEFQELFVEDDRVSQGAALLLDRIVRQGRAFGIHVLLGSQTLGGAYSLARATIGQMVVRVALQCNEADAYLIMSEDNPAPRLLSRPGEAIYNDDGGSLQGNSPFQVVWLPDQVRDQWLDKVRQQSERRAPSRPVSAEMTQRAEAVLGAPREPIVFEGNAPANVRDNPVLRTLLDADKLTPISSPRVFLGAPNSIKGPTEAVFRRASGNHLLIAGQRDEAALSMLGVGLISLAAQHAKTGARFFVFDASAPDSAEAKFLELVVAAIPHDVKLVRAGDVDEIMTALAAEQQRRTDDPGATAPDIFLLVHRLQQIKKLRFDEEMSYSLDTGAAGHPGLQLNKLLCEGASLGLHVIATCDTYNNVMRMLSRKAVSEFEMRVVFQMSANDSASLIESPQANHLGLHRAILYNGQEGWMETFRPYALPDEAWLVDACRKLAARS